MGVFKIQEKSEIEKYFHKSIASNEPDKIASDRDLTWEYHVEEFIEGTEYSTEIFVKNGNIIFYNGTKKITNNGACPYEIGHLLPLCLIEYKIDTNLYNCVKELIEVLKVENGIIHAEWMVKKNGDVYLIEAAGRIPGGFISDLISRAYGINFFNVWVNVLSRSKTIQRFNTPKKINCMRCFNPSNGIVVKINNIKNCIKSHTNLRLVSSNVTVQKGDEVIIKNNQTRVGHIICEAYPYENLLSDLNYMGGYYYNNKRNCTN